MALAKAEEPEIQYSTAVPPTLRHHGRDTGLYPVSTEKAEDEEMDRLFYCRSDKIEDEMMALPCICAAEFAAKLIVDTVRGRLFSDWETGALWVEARALTATPADGGRCASGRADAAT